MTSLGEVCLIQFIMHALRGTRHGTMGLRIECHVLVGGANQYQCHGYNGSAVLPPEIELVGRMIERLYFRHANTIRSSL